jgi:hypothetical protein
MSPFRKRPHQKEDIDCAESPRAPFPRSRAICAAAPKYRRRNNSPGLAAAAVAKSPLKAIDLECDSLLSFSSPHVKPRVYKQGKPTQQPFSSDRVKRQAGIVSCFEQFAESDDIGHHNDTNASLEPVDLSQQFMKRHEKSLAVKKTEKITQMMLNTPRQGRHVAFGMAQRPLQRFLSPKRSAQHVASSKRKIAVIDRNPTEHGPSASLAAKRPSARLKSGSDSDESDNDQSTTASRTEKLIDAESIGAGTAISISKANQRKRKLSENLSSVLVQDFPKPGDSQYTMQFRVDDDSSPRYFIDSNVLDDVMDLMQREADSLAKEQYKRIKEEARASDTLSVSPWSMVAAHQMVQTLTSRVRRVIRTTPLPSSRYATPGLASFDATTVSQLARQHQEQMRLETRKLAFYQNRIEQLQAQADAESQRHEELQEQYEDAMARKIEPRDVTLHQAMVEEHDDAEEDNGSNDHKEESSAARHSQLKTDAPPPQPREVATPSPSNGLAPGFVGEAPKGTLQKILSALMRHDEFDAME